MTGLALLIAVGGAVSYAAASLLQAVAARRSRGTVQTMRHPLYLLGICCDMLAWVGAMVALQNLAVYLVESILAGSLALTVIGARLFLASPLRRRDAAAVVVTLGALTVLAMSAGPQHEVTMTPTLRWGLCAAAVAVVAAGWIATHAGAPGGAVAALAGLSLGGAALVGRVMDGNLLTEPLTVALLTFAINGMMLYAYALQHGQVGPVTAVHWAAEVLAPSVIAVLLLGDTVRAGWGLPAMVAALLTVGSAALLASAPATAATAHPGPEPSSDPAVPPPAPSSSTPPNRVIRWGAPPVWIPPTRATAGLAARTRAELTWHEPPATGQVWTAPAAGGDHVPAPGRTVWTAPPRTTGHQWPAEPHEEPGVRRL